MQLKNVLLAVSDMERSKAFYQNFFGLSVINDFTENVILTGGLVLQEQQSWEQLTGKAPVFGNMSELFFTERDFEAFLVKVKMYLAESGQILHIRENSWGRRAVMLADPDGHLIEVAEEK